MGDPMTIIKSDPPFVKELNTLLDQNNNQEENFAPESDLFEYFGSIENNIPIPVEPYISLAVEDFPLTGSSPKTGSIPGVPSLNGVIGPSGGFLQPVEVFSMPGGQLGNPVLTGSVSGPGGLLEPEAEAAIRRVKVNYDELDNAIWGQQRVIPGHLPV